MKYTTVYVGMDVHKESFTLACYTNEKEEAEYVQRTEAQRNEEISSRGHASSCSVFPSTIDNTNSEFLILNSELFLILP